ncbi:MAG: glutaminyl-tRNA synthase (glutamine-hydrolyzing) subunit B [Candidatus Liptonbacteria bacterium RIFCSPLOWO2_01_FULL_52_25]|uniref:Aspartyl/glutamyl-tRNA(Asn/Gln) amidotransferase subunit B n=1 Tax=Candidatus Liptonbacteria bacterium RIFCSPLOWO2_01_FULL_52_25 TaxID=1798650 RepID=A0A1G2CGA3_9BACT|nr:MAG: glutaminyl-tRNA synthase (glutamine-hydrolyzing) subunit B [Candidatus Liptonbacteria bacterium RIFCSPLOWO2_01_FULL_52_25]
MEYKPTIGLEIHAELKTRTKMFCDSPNDPDPSTSLGAGEKNPNTNVCPVCLGHPGTLPTINKQAVEHVIRVGLALGGKIKPTTKFDRKNYFYPDLPKGYQISQYDKPLVEGGALNGIRIRRVHLEEDTGTLVHAQGGPSHGSGRPASLVDFNRAGVPLMELVTEPDFTSAEEVVAFARELQFILRYLGVSDADMEKGQMRIEANVSLSAKHANLGTKVELKNINSFKFAKSAIEYEIKRQTEALEKGEKLIQETRGWDEAKQKTFSQRSKEEAHDYRYFPEPDLPPFETAIFDLEKLKMELPELPAAKRIRFASEYGLNEKQVDAAIAEQGIAEFFEESASELSSLLPTTNYLLLYNYLTSDLRGLMNESGASFASSKINPEHLAHLVLLIEQGTIGSRQAKDVLKKMFDTGLDPEEIVQTEGLETVSDTGELEKIVHEVIEKNQKAVDDYKKGKTASIQFLVGQAMGRLKGRGNPETLRGLIETRLEHI